jgi:hypothetical protein
MMEEPSLLAAASPLRRNDTATFAELKVAEAPEKRVSAEFLA